MRALAQRVESAEVRVDGEVTGRIAAGLLVFVGVMRDDAGRDVDWLAKKIPGLRVFADDDGKMNRSVVDIGGKVLLVSQFTLCADVRKGTRPSFGGAMAPDAADGLFQTLVQKLSDAVPVETGRFQAHMKVGLVNDGPVTLWLDTEGRGQK